uniref:Uncharacterized protein n=1 Tax=Rhizophora mucronata TaxID=61149 RepID=A0A2P2IY48_RHIMU
MRIKVSLLGRKINKREEEKHLERRMVC